MQLSHEVAELTMIMGDAEKIIDRDKENEALTYSAYHLDKMSSILKELLRFRTLTAPISKKMEEKYRYQLRYISETLYVAGRYPRIEG